MAPLTRRERIFSSYIRGLGFDNIDWHEVARRRGDEGDDRSARAARTMWYHIRIDQGWVIRGYPERAAADSNASDGGGGGAADGGGEKSMPRKRKSNFSKATSKSKSEPQTLDDSTEHEKLMVSMINAIHKAGKVEPLGFWVVVGIMMGYEADNRDEVARFEYSEVRKEWNEMVQKTLDEDTDE